MASITISGGFKELFKTGGPNYLDRVFQCQYIDHTYYFRTMLQVKSIYKYFPDLDIDSVKKYNVKYPKINSLVFISKKLNYVDHLLGPRKQLLLSGLFYEDVLARIPGIHARFLSYRPCSSPNRLYKKRTPYER